MSIIKIDGHGMTEGTIKQLEEMIQKGEINPGNYYAVELSYNAHMGLGMADTSKFYPIKFYGTHNRELWLSYVTMGYRGEGPRGTQTALRLMQFDTLAANEQLLFEQKIVNETFFKEPAADDRIEYNYDNMHVASERLHKILDEMEYFFFSKALFKFEKEALSLKWEGKNARSFRKAVSEIITEIRNVTSPTDDQMRRLHEIAEYPRKCANIMKEKDEEISKMFDNFIK